MPKASTTLFADDISSYKVKQTIPLLAVSRKGLIIQLLDFLFLFENAPGALLHIICATIR